MKVCTTSFTWSAAGTLSTTTSSASSTTSAAMATGCISTSNGADRLRTCIRPSTATPSSGMYAFSPAAPARPRPVRRLLMRVPEPSMRGPRLRTFRHRSEAGPRIAVPAAGIARTGSATPRPARLHRVADLAEAVERLERLPRAHHHRRERVLGEEDREPGLLPEQGVEVLEQRTATGEHDAAVRDVAAHLGRTPLQVHLPRLDDAVHRLRERLAHLVRGDGERPGNAGDQV